eukprot:4903237-Pyramimonas_sp.AAC.1
MSGIGVFARRASMGAELPGAPGQGFPGQATLGGAPSSVQALAKSVWMKVQASLRSQASSLQSS